jgi:hypothetical protein
VTLRCFATSPALARTHKPTTSIHMLDMAKPRTERKGKVPTVKDDIQKTANVSVDATTRSFQGATRVTQAIASQIADYSKRSFEQGTKTVENLLGARSLDKAVEVQNEYARAAYEDYVSHVRTSFAQLLCSLQE